MTHGQKVEWFSEVRRNALVAAQRGLEGELVAYAATLGEMVAGKAVYETPADVLVSGKQLMVQGLDREVRL